VTPGAGADGTGTGVIDADDFRLWRANFGRSVPLPGGGAVSAVVVAEQQTASETLAISAETPKTERSSGLATNDQSVSVRARDEAISNFAVFHEMTAPKSSGHAFATQRGAAKTSPIQMADAYLHDQLMTYTETGDEPDDSQNTLKDEETVSQVEAVRRTPTKLARRLRIARLLH
jgi:hypothetical protein